MTILEDVRFVNASQSQSPDSYLYDYWILLPAWKLAMNIYKAENGWPAGWESLLYDEAEQDMPQEVQDWFLNNQND